MSEHPAHPGLPPRAASWRRWEMAAFDSPARDDAAPAMQAEPLSVKLREELDLLRQAAQAEGREAGYAAGHAQGRDEGLQAGTQQGREHGYQAGHAEGYAVGAETARLQAEELRALTAACADALESVQAEMGQALVSLAIDIAHQVLRSTLAAEPERILDTIRDIFHAEPERQALLQLRLNPADLDMVRKHLEEDPSLRNWRLSGDPQIERGGCVARTALGDIDATLQTRWRRVVATLGQDHPWRLAP